MADERLPEEVLKWFPLGRKRIGDAQQNLGLVAFKMKFRGSIYQMTYIPIDKDGD